jgi:hypothetical protein
VPYLTYALQFHRQPSAGPEQEAPTTAPGMVLTTKIANGTIAPALKPIAGEKATLELEFVQNHDKTLFFENGTVRFGGASGASSLSFASVGYGSLLGPPGADGFSHGVVSWQIESGTGALAGASGAISSNFLIDLETNELIDTHLGVVLLPGEEAGG